MARCVIIGNAPIEKYELIRSHFKDDDYFVFCDGGLKHKEKLGVIPDFIVGDFDSYKRPENEINTLVLPTEKDDTDTFAAIKLMLSKGYTNFLLVGVIGGRIDHSFGNISVLLYLKEHGANGVIIDDFSKIYLLCNKCEIKNGSCSYFSVISLSDELNGVNIVGAKYPLSNADVKSSFQYAISNETVSDTKISVKNGEALIIEVF
ncbi:MAG: thiamine diphosphokinase [Clostridia bacterium]|nr:thiamine diphosphokinase [Clostridia bacterium]